MSFRTFSDRSLSPDVAFPFRHVRFGRAAAVPSLLRLALVGMVTVAAGCGPAASPPTVIPQPDAPVEVSPDGRVRLNEGALPFVEVQDIVTTERASVVVAPGRAEFRQSARASVAAPVGGRVAAIHVSAGSRVERDAPLVTLTSPAAAAARAEIDKLVAAERAARDSVSREAQMLKSGVGIPAEAFAAERELAEVEAALASARKAVTFLGEGGGDEVIVRAPFAGTVIAVATAVGAAADPGNGSLVEIGDADAVYFVADVFERDLPLIAEGAPAQIETVAATAPVAGRVARVGAALHDGLRTAPVYIEIESRDVRLRPGAYGRVTIDSRSAAAVVQLPSAAVLLKDGVRPVVYVQDADGAFAARDVEVGNSIAGKVTVLAGLVAGERVVVRGALLLDGSADQLL